MKNKNIYIEAFLREPFKDSKGRFLHRPDYVYENKLGRIQLGYWLAGSVITVGSILGTLIYLAW